MEPRDGNADKCLGSSSLWAASHRRQGLVLAALLLFVLPLVAPAQAQIPEPGPPQCVQYCDRHGSNTRDNDGESGHGGGGFWQRSHERAQAAAAQRRAEGLKQNDLGNAAYQRRDWAEALRLYRLALRNLDDPVIRQNVKNAEAQLNYAEEQERREAQERRRQEEAAREQARRDEAAAREQARRDEAAAREQARLQEARQRDQAEFRRRMEKLASPTPTQPPPAPVRREYRPSGSGLIGGTTWMGAYSLQSADPRIVAKTREMLAKQMELGGIPYSEAVDFERYSFVLGLAKSTNAVSDLWSRVRHDESAMGNFTRENANAYNSLKGRQFDELACHSNGAMICLAALTNEDIVADHVVLYGPQVTEEALRKWQELIETHKVKSVQIYVNQNDPVAPFSMLFGSKTVGSAISNLALLKIDVLAKTLRETAPAIDVRPLPCVPRIKAPLDCHYMQSYKEARGCKANELPRKEVPGSRMGLDEGVLEPPPPC